MSSEQEPVTIYRENRIFLYESRAGVLKCEWGPRNEGPDTKRKNVGTVKVGDFESEDAANQFLLRRAKRMIDKEQTGDD